MVDKRDLLELAAHYVVIVVIVTVLLGGVRAAVGEIGFWGELVVVIAIVVVYRPVVKRLGVEPNAWQTDTDTDIDLEDE